MKEGEIKKISNPKTTSNKKNNNKKNENQIWQITKLK